MTATLTQLHDAIQQLTAGQAQLIADVQAFLAKVPAQPDFEGELAAIQNSIAVLANLDATVKAATPPDAPAEPAPEVTAETAEG